MASATPDPYRRVRLADIIVGAVALAIFGALGLLVDYAHLWGGPDFGLALDLELSGFLVFIIAIAFSIYLER